MAKTNVAMELRRLRGRFPGWSIRKMARELGYRDGSSYQRYEDTGKMAGKKLPLPLALRIIHKLEGKGEPPVNRNEVFALVGGELAHHGPPTPMPVEGMPVQGIVAAGVWREADFPWEPGGEPTVPVGPLTKYRGMRQFALLVEGPSINKEIQDGEYAICVHFPDLGRDVQDGELVVIQRTRDGGLHEYSVKRARMVRGGSFEFWPESTHPGFQDKLDLGEASEHIAVTVIGLVIGQFRIR